MGKYGGVFLGDPKKFLAREEGDALGAPLNLSLSPSAFLCRGRL